MIVSIVGPLLFFGIAIITITVTRLAWIYDPHALLLMDI
jgi:hypothetical protein